MLVCSKCEKKTGVPVREIIEQTVGYEVWCLDEECLTPIMEKIKEAFLNYANEYKKAFQMQEGSKENE